MRSDVARGRRDAGFSLIEVVVALLLLAIGLLGVEALGVSASRMMARAEKKTIWVGAASDTLERTVAHLQQGDLPGTVPFVSTYRLSSGDTVRLAVSNSAVANTVAGGTLLWTVRVSVYPNRRGTLLLRSDSIGMSANVVR